MADKCDHCQLSFADHDSGDGPAVFLIFIIGFVAVPIGVLLHFSFDLPSWAPAVIIGGIAIAMALVLLRPTKAYVIGLQYRHRGDVSES